MSGGSGIDLNNGISLQWHITERCNWNCRHCYRGDIASELPLEKLYAVFLQFIRLLDIFGIPRSMARLNLVGGEIFLRDDFLDFLDRISPYNGRYRLKILTNGSLLNKDVVARLKAAGVHTLQLSVEGIGETNDKIRGQGTFSGVLKTIEFLTASGMSVVVSVTLAQYNFREIPELIDIFTGMGVMKLGIRRLVPIGNHQKDLFSGMISPLEQRDFYMMRYNLAKADTRGKQAVYNHLCCEDGIFFQEEGPAGEYDSPVIPLCGVLSNRILTVMPNGDVLPCRRLPIVLGNALESSLVDIWFSSKVLNNLKDPRRAAPVCKECKYFSSCRGGARCVSYGYFGTLDAPDPQCWRLFQQLP